MRISDWSSDVCSSDLHQDRLAAAAGLDPEQRAAVLQQVELDVAAAPVELELALAFAVRRVAAALDDRHVRVEETVADRAQVVEVAFEIRVQVVEEQTAHAKIGRASCRERGSRYG